MQSNGKKITTGANILANEKSANLDYKYGPYTSREQAMEVLGEDGLDVLAVGLTVGIIDTEEGIVEYQFKKGTTLNDLVRKFPKSGSTTADNDYNVPSGESSQETEQIDSNREVQSFLSGFNNEDNLKDILDEQNKELTEDEMAELTSLFPTE